MKEFSDPSLLRSYIHKQKQDGMTIGFVPTMGYLHDGHTSLIRRARSETDFVVVSIFVNPIQFGQDEDLSSYPRNYKRDTALLEQENIDCVFYPSPDIMYPPDYSTYVMEEKISRYWCGAKRPGHFRGVCTIVARLFNCTMPNFAYFGQKDIQQALILQKMITDLFMPITIVICPIIRELDGLAMSSRNVYLSVNERHDALVLKKALDFAKHQFGCGITSAERLTQGMHKIITSAESARIDYIGCADGTTLEPKQFLTAGDRIVIAVFIGKTRLIDNCIL